MNCEEARTLLPAYLDGELDLARSLELEGHLATCPACGSEHRRQQSIQDAFAGATLAYRAPAALRPRVAAAVRREAGAPARRGWHWNLLGAAAGLALLALIAWGIIRGPLAASQRNLVAQEVLSSSMRALLAGPLLDVQSSDQHTVKPWFAGKLDFAPVVQDLAADGFPLAGGRLDYVGGRPVAALVYRHQQHVINLYTWPAAAGLPPLPSVQNRQGYNISGWTQDGMTYWAVSDMDANELRQFVQLLMRRA